MGLVPIPHSKRAEDRNNYLLPGNPDFLVLARDEIRLYPRKVAQPCILSCILSVPICYILPGQTDGTDSVSYVRESTDLELAIGVVLDSYPYSQ